MPERPKPEPVSDPLLQALFGEDELGVVIRAHIHIEARLNEVLDLLVPYPDQLPRLRYEQRARLACALGLKEDIFPPLKALGDIRNRFGHKLDTSLTAAMVDELYDAFSPDERDVLLRGYEMTNKQLRAAPPSGSVLDAHRNMPHDFSALGARDKFIMIVVTLDKMLLVARKELEVRRSQEP
jgi:hypothetical protein